MKPVLKQNKYFKAEQDIRLQLSKNKKKDSPIMQIKTLSYFSMNFSFFEAK